MEAQNVLQTAKLNQALATNKNCNPDPSLVVEDKVMLSTTNRYCEYKAKGCKHTAKFFPWYDSPFDIVEAYSTLQVRNSLMENPHLYCLPIYW